jgi:hypothetical protein
MSTQDIWLPTYIKRDSPEPEYYGIPAHREYEETATLINDTIAGNANQYIWLYGFDISIQPGTAKYVGNLVFGNLFMNNSATRILYNLSVDVSSVTGIQPLNIQRTFPRPLRTINAGGSLDITVSAGASGTGLVSLVVYMWIM